MAILGNSQVESLQANVERLNAYKSKLVLFPLAGKPNTGASKEELEAVIQQKEILPVEKVTPTVEFMEVTPEMKKQSAFMGLRQARNDARNVGRRARRAAAEASKEA